MKNREKYLFVFLNVFINLERKFSVLEFVHSNSKSLLNGAFCGKYHSLSKPSSGLTREGAFLRRRLHSIIQL